MGHRHIYSTSQLSDMENGRNWNRPHLNSRLHLENGSFILPVENIAVSRANTMACFNIALRSNDLPPSNFGWEYPNYRAANPGTPHYPYLYTSSAGSSSRVPPDYVWHGPCCPNRSTIGGMSRTINPQMDYGRTPFKRKSPTSSMPFNSGSTSSYYGDGSSSSLHVPSDHLQPVPVLCHQCWPQYPSYGGNDLLIGREGSHRNVRSRHSHPLNSDINSYGAHPSGNLPHYIHPSGNLPHYIPMSNISGPSVAGQWSHPPVSSDIHRIILSSGSNLTSSSMEMERGYYNSISSRYPVAPLPVLHHVPSTRGTGIVHSSQGHRTTYRATPGYQFMGSAALLEDSRQPGVESVASSRHPRPLGRRSSERIGRSRNFYGRFQLLSSDDNAQNRWVPETVAMMDLSTFDSWSLFDQHRDMRLDIDDMSYEELLALEERIGNVSTGVSENKVSNCLTKLIYCSDQTQADQEEENCIICLEEYKDKESLGRLRCRHDFHFSCIKKWLVVKNVCPICKASAAKENMEEQSTASS